MKLLRELYDENDHPSFPSVDDGISCLSNRYARSRNRSFLIVVDDIDHHEQLEALVVSDELNKSGNSLVIATTRDVGVLINAGITVAYNLKGMDADDKKELFCWHAFSRCYPFGGYEKLVDHFVDLCGGLPLSLQVLGRHVHGEDKKFWELELGKVKKTLPQDIH
ncbi:disease resistance protein Roq1-like [Cryptomeria japonica]|uniref:disease resistance protein Roq1-like n=1 Tax=Cryptomeria japonica TaxID=3369 RepID=UPI0027DA6846|nr:disease resistance protein Roq1-like [Cryptomeria japonica]